MREHNYELVFAAIAAMGESEPTASDFADGDAVENANNFLACLQAFEIPVPKVFSHGGDTIAFTWEVPRRRYVTPVEGVGVLFEPSVGGGQDFERSYELSDSHELSRLMKVLGGGV